MYEDPIWPDILVMVDAVGIVSLVLFFGVLGFLL